MTTVDPKAIRLRSATDDDRAFLIQVYQSCRGDDLRKLGWDEDRISEFLEMQFEAQQRFFQGDFPEAREEVVLLDGEPVGYLSISRQANEIRCVDVALLPEHRNRGVGTILLTNLQKQAAAANRVLRLQVIRFNRAVTLFERLGFVQTSETGTHFQMEWTAGE